ncbi:MAG: polysaccharide biosynthesis/export family protein [Sandarakinorhabdus sp.]|nr:polysaccharide biosynthesis/export family protein [Sandarakinorhabdus sp.]
MTASIMNRVVAAALLLGSTVAIAADPAYQGYVLGPDDTVQISVYGQPEAGVSTRIKADGTIVMPLLGIVQVAGQTNITLAKLIADKLTQGGFLKAPVVNVEVGSYVSKTVNVAGNVGGPGIVPLDRPYRVLDVLLKSGWVRENGASYVYLRRPGVPEMRLDVEGLVRGDADKNPLMRDGDTLYVPGADQFFISGPVGRPGPLPILPGMTVRQALIVAGGVGPTGSSNKVGLIRGNAKEVDADLSTVVQKNDIIIVRERMF